ncbi:transposase family protein [Streptomyces sp. NPDC051577]|uniref:transposase family protein n=1 Tax=Streptomyces sp. NPDC051577 TaxID=3155166 RepID=UPI00341F6566
MKQSWARAACAHPALSGVSHQHLGELIEELAPRWAAARESVLRERRGGNRRRAAGAGRKQKLVFTDRLLVTLVHLRHQLPHAVLAELYGVDRSTVSSAIREVRALLAARGFAVPDHPDLRIRTLEDLFAYAEAEDVVLRVDGTEVQVRRPRAGRPGRKAFVSGKKKQNTIKSTAFSDGQGRTLFSGVIRPGRTHDQTAVRSEGIAEQLRLHPAVKARVDDGYRGLANEFPDQITAPPRKPYDDAPLGEHHAWREAKRRQSSNRICVEHTNAEHKQWHPSSATPADAKPTPKPTSRSPAWSPTAPPAGPPDTGQAPNSSSSTSPPTDHTPAELPGQHAQTPISPNVVRELGRVLEDPRAGVRYRSGWGALTGDGRWAEWYAWRRHCSVPGTPARGCVAC